MDFIPDLYVEDFRSVYKKIKNKKKTDLKNVTPKTTLLKASMDKVNMWRKCNISITKSIYLSSMNMWLIFSTHQIYWWIDVILWFVII